MIIEKTIAENGRYDIEMRDYVAENELTVTITLNEYRALIKESVENKRRKEHEDWLKEYNRANTAEAKVKELEAEVSNLYKRLAEHQPEGAAENNDQR